MNFICDQCPRRCHAHRTDTVGNGMCGMPAQPVVARAALHVGEEPCISGTCGSGTVFFSGCALRCRFCQNAPISHGKHGKVITVERLAAIFRELEATGAHNINLVNPTHYAHAICEALSLYKPSVPVLYNTSGYESVETLRSLEGLVDVYLPDCKYADDALAKDISGVVEYASHAHTAILEMARQTGPVELDETGLIRRGTIVRHLALPGHTKDSMAVLDWLAQHKDTLWVSLMFQYTPMGTIADRKELTRTLTKRECNKLLDYMQALDITNGYVQSRQSVGEDWIPTFDLTGV